MKKRARSTKSWRLKIAAFTWLHGGHQMAPQYRNTGRRCTRASAKAASTSPLRHAIAPSLCVGWATPVTAEAAVLAACSAEGGGFGGSAGREHAAMSAAAATDTSVI